MFVNTNKFYVLTNKFFLFVLDTGCRHQSCCQSLSPAVSLSVLLSACQSCCQLLSPAVSGENKSQNMNCVSAITQWLSSGIVSTFVCVSARLLWLLFEDSTSFTVWCVSPVTVLTNWTNCTIICQLGQFCHCQEYRLAKSLATDTHRHTNYLTHVHMRTG